MRLHSVSGAITNSSTELFVVDTDITEGELYALAADLWQQIQDDPGSLGISGYELETAQRLLGFGDWAKDARRVLGTFRTYTPPVTIGSCPHCGELLMEGSLDEGYDPYGDTGGDDNKWVVQQFGTDAVPGGRLYSSFATDEGGYPYALLNVLQKALQERYGKSAVIRRHS